MKYHSLRSCIDWKNEGLKMNTASDEACKLYDASLTQIIHWTDSAEHGGLDSTLNRMIESDSNFILGRVLKSGIQLIGCSNPGHHTTDINQLKELSANLSDALTLREKYHVSAVNNLYRGDLLNACDDWEHILVENPTDLMAIKFLQDTYFYLGYSRQMRDSISRILPYWKQAIPLYSYVYGMYSFGLVQSNFFDEAFKTANLALSYDAHDSWATHTVAHYYEYTNDFNAGMKFLKETETDWNTANYLMGHNYWHLALYNIENNNHEAALNIFDSLSNKTDTLDMVDLSALLFRLKLDSCKLDLSEKWQHIKQQFEKRVDYHGYVFNDSHVLMMLSACGDESCLKEFFSSLQTYISDKSSDSFLKTINKRFAADIFNSIVHFDRNEFAEAFDLLYPHKYDIINIGGSNAQRDLFHQMLTISALRSPNAFHKKIGLNLINERVSLKPNSCLTKRIASRFATSHLD